MVSAIASSSHDVAGISGDVAQSSSSASPKIPSELYFTENFAQGQIETKISIGLFEGGSSSEVAFAHALTTPHRDGVICKRVTVPSQNSFRFDISFRVWSPNANQDRPKDWQVELVANDFADLSSGIIRNVGSLSTSFGGFFRFPERQEEDNLLEGVADQAMAALSGSQDLDLMTRSLLGLPNDDDVLMLSESSSAESVVTNSGKMFVDMNPLQMLQNATWIMGGNFCKELFAGQTQLGNHIECNNLQFLCLPEHIQEVGDHFHAPSLVRLDFYTHTQQNSYLSEKSTTITGGQIQRLGDYFNAPSLTTLDLSNQNEFKDFGTHFNAPNLVELSLKDAEGFERFPDDIQFPQLTTLDLSGAKNFQGFHPDFFKNAPELKSIEINGTGVRYLDLPREVREDETIYIDKRPAGVGNQRLDGQQTTHQQSIHFSSTESAKRIVKKAVEAGIDFEKEWDKLKEYVMSLPDPEVPEGLGEYLDKSLSEQIDHVRSLYPDKWWELETDEEKDIYFSKLTMTHPHWDYYANPVRAAKQGVSQPQVNHAFVDPKSDVTVKTYVTACWFLKSDPANLHEQVAPETANEAIVHILYELKRGYNLHGKGFNLKDDADPRGRPICGGGAFNKTTNKMSEISYDASTLYVTDDSIQMQTFAMIREKIKSMLLSKEITVSDLEKADDGDEILCSEALSIQIRGELHRALCEQLKLEGEPHGEVSLRATKIAGYLDYQLTRTDLQDIVKSTSMSA